MDKIFIHQVCACLKKFVRQFSSPVVDLIEEESRDPFKVLVSAMLSARTKDETTRRAADKLFSRISGPKDLEKLSVSEIEKLIYPVGFYKTKARHLKKLPNALKKFGGKVPDTIAGLLELPGVGRKTANLVLAVAFKKPAICVDTHVHRIMNRLGCVRTRTPHETEAELRKKLPKEYWRDINSILVAFGQNVCRPVSPKCDVCPVRGFCRFNALAKNLKKGRILGSLMKPLLKKIEQLKADERVRCLVQSRIREFKNQKDLFSELCLCLLTANFRADKSMKIQKKIGGGFWTLPQEELARKLQELGHRFPNTRAKFICEARERWSEIKQILKILQGEKLRMWLVKNVRGLGMKEASHFLRNIGYEDFAIIDFHILDILARHGLIKKPKTLTQKKYLEVEAILRNLAKKGGLTLSELDLYLWFAETGKVLK